MNIISAIRGQAGFTLVEIVVILVISAIVLPAIILPFVVGIRDFNLPVIQGTLAFLAQEEMESKIICLNYNAIAPWNSTGISGFPDYTSTCAINEVENGIKEITVTVNHSEGAITLVTVKTDWD